jgi:Mg-chelatase subunit ChlD
MNEEDLNQLKMKGRDPVADDIKFMRSVVERMSRQVKPDIHIMIACGLGRWDYL